jgi:site-specific recombinase XerD
MKTFYQRLQVMTERAGITKKVGTHTLRHSIATHLLQSGWKLEQVSTFLGHASIDSTQIYTHLVENLKYQENES